jgi:hypothetical protein
MNTKTTKKRKNWTFKMSEIMLRAWKLFKGGIVSLSMSMKISWKVAKGVITAGQLKKMMLKGGMRA